MRVLAAIPCLMLLAQPAAAEAEPPYFDESCLWMKAADGSWVCFELDEEPLVHEALEPGLYILPSWGDGYLIDSHGYRSGLNVYSHHGGSYLDLRIGSDGYRHEHPGERARHHRPGHRHDLHGKQPHHRPGHIERSRTPRGGVHRMGRPDMQPRQGVKRSNTRTRGIERSRSPQLRPQRGGAIRPQRGGVMRSQPGRARGR
jgi:hypothetical protein